MNLEAGRNEEALDRAALGRAASAAGGGGGHQGVVGGAGLNTRHLLLTLPEQR